MNYDPKRDKLVEPGSEPFVANKHDPFYVAVGCTLCNEPERVAPSLIGDADKRGNPPKHPSATVSCCFRRQPQTEEEVILAAEAMNASCVECLAYRGSDPWVLDLLVRHGASDYCDALPANVRRREQKKLKKNWKFWRRNG